MLSYHVSLLSLSQQTLRVTLHIPAQSDILTLRLPSWIPGSYKVRDFARNLGEFSAKTLAEEPLKWIKKDKHTWQVYALGNACSISYVVVANDYSVRGAFINDEYAFFNGTSLFLEVQNATDTGCKVTIDKHSAPTDWQCHTAMQKSGHSYQCDSYATLIDHPFFWGIAQTAKVSVENITFMLLLSGTQPVDINRITSDLAPICKHHLDLFGKPYPVSEYLFITLLSDTGYGGLEHRESTVLMYPRFELPLIEEGNCKSDGYIDFLSLCSHELFHTWHVKRIRPSVLLKPDLTKEVYTEQLWIYEGITSFYDDLAVVRSGQMSPEHYCEVLAKHLTRLMHTPGRHKQSVIQSSFDAWTRFYQQDASSPNHIVSYYTKGGIIALGLDILIRERSQNSLNLDRIMRSLWQQFGINESGTPDNVIEALCSQHGIDISDYIGSVVNNTQDVDIENLLPKIGLTVNYRARQTGSDKGGTRNTAASENGKDKDMGMTLTPRAELGLNVTQIVEDSAASDAGLLIGDTIIAADNWVVNETSLIRLLNQKAKDTALTLSVIRQGRLKTLAFPVREAKERAVYLTVTDKQRYLNWLGINLPS